MQRALAATNLILAFIATTAPLAHVLELPAKLSLDGSLWLLVQQQLYRGWGPLFGPIEIAALLSSMALAFSLQAEWRTYAVAAVCYGLMLACFFLFNDPVNQAVNSWTVASLPGTWPSYRVRWELGHALSALFSIIAFAGLTRARIRRGAQERADL